MPLPIEPFEVREVHPYRMGARRELFTDGFLVGSLTGSAHLSLHEPMPRDVVLVHDEPWEGNTCGYHTIFRDPILTDAPFRMIYRGSHSNPRPHQQHPQFSCLAVSDDGIHWRKPNLNLVAFQGSLTNNILRAGGGTHNFTPFIDTNPACAPDRRYKAVGGTKEEGGLFAFQSPDGIHWAPLQDAPILTQGALDSQNLAFWDPLRAEYRAYVRDFRVTEAAGTVRDIVTTTSPDFLHWSDPVWLSYTSMNPRATVYGVRPSPAPAAHLYTNQVMPYPRAPHLFLGFPSRFLPDRGEMTEGLLMTSRDGVHFARWDDAFLAPGPNPERWHNRSGYIWWGLVETASSMPGAPPELSLFANEHYYGNDGVITRRYTIRLDGFVSVRADFGGGCMTTRPLIFEGSHLSINASTAAAGEILVEIQRPDGRSYDGYALDDCIPFYGDAISHVVRWSRGTDVSQLAGRTVRVRAQIRDADVYALQFQAQPDAQRAV